jgi:hypothetical protein
MRKIIYLQSEVMSRKFSVRHFGYEIDFIRTVEEEIIESNQGCFANCKYTMLCYEQVLGEDYL